MSGGSHDVFQRIIDRATTFASKKNYVEVKLESAGYLLGKEVMNNVLAMSPPLLHFSNPCLSTGGSFIPSIYWQKEDKI